VFFVDFNGGDESHQYMPTIVSFISINNIDIHGLCKATIGLLCEIIIEYKKLQKIVF
jgi:hypothetical protein